MKPKPFDTPSKAQRDAVFYVPTDDLTSRDDGDIGSRSASLLEGFLQMLFIDLAQQV